MRFWMHQCVQYYNRIKLLTWLMSKFRWCTHTHTHTHDHDQTVYCNHVLHVNQHITVAMLDITVIFYVNKYTIWMIWINLCHEKACVYFFFVMKSDYISVELCCWLGQYPPSLPPTDDTWVNMEVTGRNQRTRRKPCPSAILSTANPTWTALGHCSEKLANDWLLVYHRNDFLGIYHIQ